MDHLTRTLLTGFVIGIVAKFMTAGREIGAFVASALIGMIGSFAATYVGEGFGIYRSGQSAGIVGDIVGAALLVAFYHLVVPRKNY
jgi:uncharacterized membrane protein YeaQ/YmgE (transglycosylase-associated protein family)